MLTWIFAAVVGALLLFPQSFAGRALRRLLVEKPAEALSRLRRGHLGLVVLLAAMGAAAVALGREGVVIAGQTPEVVAWFAAFDIATYVEVFATAVVLIATVRLKEVAGAVRVALGRVLAFRRAPRSVRRPTRRRTPPADPDGPAWGRAAAWA